MNIVLGAFLPFAVMTVALPVFWRFVRTRHPYAVLSVLYLAVFAAWHLMSIACWKRDALMPHGAEDWVATTLLYVLGLHAFFSHYASVESDTPSMTLVTLIDQAGPDGISREDIVAGFRAQGAVEDRLNAMEKGGLVRRDRHGMITATPLGTFVRRLLDVWFQWLYPGGAEDA